MPRFDADADADAPVSSRTYVRGKDSSSPSRVFSDMIARRSTRGRAFALHLGTGLLELRQPLLVLRGILADEPPGCPMALVGGRGSGAGSSDESGEESAARAGRLLLLLRVHQASSAPSPGPNLTTPRPNKSHQGQASRVASAIR